MTRVIGIDPGLTRCGMAVVDINSQHKPSLVHVEVVGTDAHDSLDQRLLVISNAIDDLLDSYKPDSLAVERVFSYLNVSTVMGTAQASGIVLAAGAKRSIPVALHTPTEIKATVTGYGQANKEAVTKMVTKILNLATAPKPADAADAIALAITHAWRGSSTDAPASRVGSAATQKVTHSLQTPAQKKWTEALKAAR